MYFSYGEREINYLKSKDKRLAAVIDEIGLIQRKVDPDLFSSVIHHIIGQQISMKAQQTIWNRMNDLLGHISPKTISDVAFDQLQALGMTYRKAEYIKDFSTKILNRTFDLEAVKKMSNKDAIFALSQLKGIGVWTAELILLFCLQRLDVFSYDDLAIHRGLRMVYHHRQVNRSLFERYRRRFSPYGSVASLYLWAVSGGAISNMKDFAPQKSHQTKGK